MKRASWLVFVLAIAATGCARRILGDGTSGGVGPDSAGPGIAATPRPAGDVYLVADNLAADDGAPPMPNPNPPPPTNAGDAAGSLLDKARGEAALDAAARKALLDQALASAREAQSAGSYDDARNWYGKALELDPTNAEANEGWKNLNMDRPSTTSEYFERSVREEAVRRDQAATEVQARLKRGRAMEASEDFAGAIKEYNAALAILSWYTNQSAFGTTSEALKDLVENTRAKADAKARGVRAKAIERAQRAKEIDLASEREERMSKVRNYFREADLAYRRHEYGTAMEYARQVLREDPQNESAKRLIDISRDGEHFRKSEESKRRFDDEWKSVFERLERDALPQVKPVEFPDDWREFTAHRRAKTIGDSGPVADAESKAAIVATLEAKRVKGLVFQEQNLDQVTTYLRTVTGLNFHITPKVRTGKFEDVKVTLGPLDDVSVKLVLDLITTQHDLRWEPRNGVVTIALKEEVAGRHAQRFFDVKELAVKIQSHRGTEIFLAPSNFTAPEPPELPEPQAILDSGALTDMIKATIQPDSWQIEGASVEVKNGQLIVKNTPEVIDEIDRLLERLRENAGPLVHLEVRFLTVEDNFLRDVGVDVRGLGDDSQGVGQAGLGTNAPHDDVFFGTPANPQGSPFGVHPEPSSGGTGNDSGIFYNDGQDGGYQARVENLYDSVLGNPNVLLGTGGLSFQHTFLDDVQMEVILRAVQKSERIQRIVADQITVWNTQRATMEVLNKVAYVADYDVEIAQASNIANPIIKNAIDGVVLDVRPVVSADRRWITLELRPTVATLVRPIPTFSTSLASGPITANSQVIIQVPKLQKSSVRTTVTMPDGGTLLLGGLKFYENVDATSEVPVLGKIPILGFLFSRKGHYVNRRNVIVLITATVEALEEQEPQGGLAPLPRSLNSWTPIEDAPAIGPCDCPPPACGR